MAGTFHSFEVPELGFAQPVEIQNFTIAPPSKRNFPEIYEGEEEEEEGRGENENDGNRILPVYDSSIVMALTAQ